MSPGGLSWGRATVEYASDSRMIALHIFAHSLESPLAVERTIRFVIARLAWHSTQLPKGFSSWVAFDDRGQAISEDVRAALRSALGLHVARVAFMSEGPLKA